MGNSEPKDGKDDGIWIRNLTWKRIRDIKWDGLFMSILLLDNHPFIVVSWGFSWILDQLVFCFF